MQKIPIQAIPNQEFTTVLDGNNWDIIIRQTNGVMSISLALNGTKIIENLRTVAGRLIIPSRYQESGNFIFTTADFQMPDYVLFNVTQGLFYISAAELAVIRIPRPIRITKNYFNPIAALPLRFAPQGYTLA